MGVIYTIHQRLINIQNPMFKYKAITALNLHAPVNLFYIKNHAPKFNQFIGL